MGAAGSSCGGAPRKPVILSAVILAQQVGLRLGQQNTSAPSLARGCREARLWCSAQEAPRGSAGELRPAAGRRFVIHRRQEGIPGATQPAEKARRPVEARENWHSSPEKLAQRIAKGEAPSAVLSEEHLDARGLTTLLGRLRKMRRFHDCENVFNWAATKVSLNTGHYNTVISAMGDCRQSRKALEVFAGMKKAGVEPDVISYSSLI
ncbi:hypothetical protein CYMTET_33422, partial [Cymbomonas tetramitiformis]